ncbi:unnamed protein product [Linum tenue]|uniref:Uncharacterized protein n=1 Tax=Linum tenue TaxID=586396 RepID=A0AAV0KTR5_9ROSI|nr:unnamed protein product [Linum tenue]
MAALLSLSPGSVINQPATSHQSRKTIVCRRIARIRCGKASPSTDPSAKQEETGNNAILKLAWYGSELLGVAASLFRPPREVESPLKGVELARDGSGTLDHSAVVQAIKQDFQRSYFVTGNLTLEAYEENCEFADPAGSFKGLRRFKRNCSNFGLLIQTSNMKLTNWEDFEDKGIGHWKFSCIMSFPWRPILSATGFTEYYFDPQTGRVYRHVENWNVPKMALLKQLLRPSRGSSKTKAPE